MLLSFDSQIQLHIAIQLYLHNFFPLLILTSKWFAQTRFQSSCWNQISCPYICWWFLILDSPFSSILSNSSSLQVEKSSSNLLSGDVLVLESVLESSLSDDWIWAIRDLFISSCDFPFIPNLERWCNKTIDVASLLSYTQWFLTPNVSFLEYLHSCFDWVLLWFAPRFPQTVKYILEGIYALSQEFP